MQRRTSEEWAEILAAFDRSDQSQAAFAKQRGISAGTLGWRLCLRRRLVAESKAGTKPAAGFVELAGSVSPVGVTLSLPSGAVLRFETLPPASWVRALVLAR